MLIKPTVGQVVWFYPSDAFLIHRRAAGAPFVYDGLGPCAAIIAKVHSDIMVNLSCFDQVGKSHEVTSCPLRQEGEAVPPDATYCEYQKAKTEQLEAAAAAEHKPQRHEYSFKTDSCICGDTKCRYLQARA